MPESKKNQMHVAKNELLRKIRSLRHSTPCFVRPDETPLSRQCENRNRRTLLVETTRRKAHRDNDKIPLDRRPPNATTCGNSVLLRARLSMIITAGKSIVNDFRRILMISAFGFVAAVFGAIVGIFVVIVGIPELSTTARATVSNSVVPPKNGKTLAVSGPRKE
jgi:hypothetical protein